MDGWLVACRALHYAAALILFGIAMFQAALAPADLARALDAPLRPVVAICIVAAGATALGWLGLAAGQMGEGWSDVADPATWAAVLVDTGFGRVWLAHLAIAAALLLLLATDRTARWRVTLALSGLLLASLGAIGHAAMREGAAGWLNRASHGLHLLAGGFWLGALVPLLICLARDAGEGLRRSTAVALRRFSGLGHLAVALVLATGALNTRLVLGAWPVDPASPYQRLLLAKICVVAGMVGVALVNRYALVPRLRRGDDALPLLRILTMVELVAGGIAVGLVACLGTLAPI